VPSVTTLDWVLLTVVLVSTALGLWRGLVYELLSVAGWVLAFWLAQRHAPWAAGHLPLQAWGPPLQLAAGFVVLFVAVAFAAGLVSWLVRQLVSSVGLRPVDRVLGGLFGVLRGLLLLLGLTMVVQLTPVRQEAWWQASAVAGVLSSTLKEIRPLLPEHLAIYLPGA